jgi:hypothetical protein
MASRYQAFHCPALSPATSRMLERHGSSRAGGIPTDAVLPTRFARREPVEPQIIANCSSWAKGTAEI